MISRVTFQISVVLAALVVWLTSARAELAFTALETGDGLRFVFASGDFESGTDFHAFSALVEEHDPVFVAFESRGGNVLKAMEFGHLIRDYRLSTVQPRGLECSSACALAFMGGVNRFAEPGTIGVHQASFSALSFLDRDSAVKAVQLLTAEAMAYMSEMGIDSRLIQLAQSYEPEDMRYLSISEMRHYRVVTSLFVEDDDAAEEPHPSVAPTQPHLTKPHSTEGTDAKQISRLTGRVLRPSGSAVIKLQPSSAAHDIAVLPNGTRVSILDSTDRWYRVQLSDSGLEGYMHHTWISVDQYKAGTNDEHRYIQIKSYRKLENAETYIRSVRLPLSAYIATNGWFAITLNETYQLSTAIQLLSSLKQQGTIPPDSFITYGNTYIQKVCCD